MTKELCMCKDRKLVDCPGEWEPGCDLGANEKHTQVAECKCSFRVRMVGDGCAVCNPELALEYAREKNEGSE